MAAPDPIPAINQWSCTLACISWTLAKYERPMSQQEIIYQFGLWYPEWFHRAGLTGRGDKAVCGNLDAPFH